LTYQLYIRVKISVQGPTRPPEAFLVTLDATLSKAVDKESLKAKNQSIRQVLN